MHKLLKIIFITLALGLLNSVAAAAEPPTGKKAGGAAGSGGKPGGPMPVEVAKVEPGTVTLDISAVGSLRANESVVIRSEIAGRVDAIHFSEGQLVAQGADLLSLDASEFRAQLAESASSVKLNQLNYQRAKDLVGKKLLSQQSYDEAQAKLTQSRANQSLQEARLAKTQLKAPFAGVLGLRQVSPGDYVQPGQDIVNLEDISTLKLDFRVPETYLADIKAGQQVNLQVDAYPNRRFSGKVYAIDPRVDEKTRTLLLRGLIPNPDGLLRPGMFARVSLVLAQRDNALLIPEQALVPKGNTQSVYRIVDGKAVQTNVKIGQRRAGKVEILEGLATHDSVVIGGQMKLQDGMPIQPLVQPETKTQAAAGQ
ncbi:MAG TPA: efflux RND transporter periplasmic adaptor subunit [Gammaproteobacteria bacterium]|nr:efflux RND transporter periplasmic adaptor subunit [Gammaproteobacteria bacterium]